jgi:hypothetical protein
MQVTTCNGKRGVVWGASPNHSQHPPSEATKRHYVPNFAAPDMGAGRAPQGYDVYSVRMQSASRQAGG